MIEVPEGLIRPEVQLVGQDGNAYMVMGLCRKALLKAGNSQEIVDAYLEEAQSSDYDHLLQTSMEYCDVS